MAPLEEMQCRTREGWVPLPGWARSIIALGQKVARSNPENARLVVALALPSRAFAAALASAAVVVTRFELDALLDTDLAEHFELLASLPTGTAITHHRDNAIRQGTLIGIEERDNIRLVTIETGSGKQRMATHLPLEMCGEIQLIEDPGELRLTKRPLIRAPEFLARVLAGLDAAGLSAMTRTDCVLVGSLEPLRQEIVTEQFAVDSSGDRREGNLQAILRVKRFASQNHPYRSEVVATGAESVPAVASEASPAAVIFDGGSGFLNWRSRWPRSNWIVLLDRSSPSTQPAVDAINYSYSTRLDASDVLTELKLHPSIEAISYLERAP